MRSTRQKGRRFRSTSKAVPPKKQILETSVKDKFPGCRPPLKGPFSNVVAAASTGYQREAFSHHFQFHTFSFPLCDIVMNCNRPLLTFVRANLRKGPQRALGCAFGSLEIAWGETISHVNVVEHDRRLASTPFQKTMPIIRACGSATHS